MLNKNVPDSDEYREAIQETATKELDEAVSKMTPEAANAVAKFREAVGILKGTGVPFVLMGSPEDTLRWIQFTSYTNAPYPPDEEELRKIRVRMFNALYIVAKHYTTLTHDTVVLFDEDKNPRQAITHDK